MVESEVEVSVAILILCFLGQAPETESEFFESQVRPLLVAKCYRCHGAQEQRGGLRLDSAAAFRKGAESGPIIDLKDPDQSRILLAVRRIGEIKMPPEKPLSETELERLIRWIRAEAVWPDYVAATGNDSESGKRVKKRAKGGQAEQPEMSLNANFSLEEKAFWSFQPVQSPSLPVVEPTSRIHTPIDHFIMSRLQKAGILPAPQADRRTLIRRAYFDLIGLPPSPQEVADFVSDQSDTAYVELVERLLASPHYGERWARHWLDVVRYADTTAHDGNYIMRYAYRYRDYVVQAFNDDKPYNEFILEQLAGDLIPAMGDQELTDRRAIATGFLLLGPKALAEQDKQMLLFDIVDEQIDVTSRAFLGLTVACSRCHDHKFDPIPTADYYSWAGIFHSTRTMADTEFVSKWMERPLRPPPPPMFLAKETAELNLARQGTARQSTENVGNFPASRAIDGVPVNFSHTADGDPSPWWEVTLTEDTKISLIGLWNRQDCCATRLSNFRVSVLDSDLTCVFNKDFFADGKGFPPTDRGFYISVPADVIGRTVRVELLGPNSQGEHWLQLAEVEVYANQSASSSLSEVKMVMAVEEEKPRDINIYQRGDHKRPGPLAPRRFLQILDGAGHAAFETADSGRLELAGRIADDENPLTARVMVNRIWQGHFRTGLVATSDNFGQLGAQPSHPQLLDWLAAEFIRSRWSVKHVHRTIMHSAVYQQSSLSSELEIAKGSGKEEIGDVASLPQAIDPDNRWLWKFPRRRLTAEELRDTLLRLGGQLDTTLGGSLLDVEKDGGVEDEKRGLYSAAAPAGEFVAYGIPRRSIYLPVIRNTLHEVFQLFDFANANAVTSRRGETTVAPQALYLLNSPFVQQQAKRFALQLLDHRFSRDEDRVWRAHQMVLSRAPSAEETREALHYVHQASERFSHNGQSAEEARQTAWSSYCQLMFSLNEFVYVE